VLVSVMGWPFEWKALVFEHDFRIYFILTRIFWATLALFTVGVWLFFRNYPTPVRPNVVRHTYIAATFFSLNALSWLALTLSGVKLAAQVNISIVAGTMGCFAAWAVLLTRKGEERESIPVMPPEEIARIERVNQELLIMMRNFPG